MQIPGDPAALLVLGTQKLSGELSQLLFGLLSILNIGIRPIPP
jgi:hypothetical protein